MHEAVTKSTTSKVLLPQAIEELLPPINLKPRQQPAETLIWPQKQDSGGEKTKLDPTLSSKDKTTPPRSRRSAQTGPLQKLTFPTMPSRTDSNINGEIRVADQSAARWKFNMDNDGAPVWDLADEIVNLSINEIPRDADDGRGQIRTPPKSKLAAATVTQMSEASPLDSSSSTSVGSSPHPLDHQIGISHSRGSSTDTTISSSQESAGSAASKSRPDGSTSQNDAKERPHSFSGGLSPADLRRLQQTDQQEPRAPIPQQAWVPPVAYRDNFVMNEKPFSPDQLSYPSLANTRHQLAQQAFARDEVTVDFNAPQQRGFAAIPQVSTSTANLPFVTGRPTNAAPNMPYRQTPRGFGPQGLLPSPTALGYPPSHHTSHLSLGTTQQLYDMMLSAPHEAHPAVTRVQQQHNIYRTNHHHSASDPSTIRDAATLALLSGNMQAFPQLFPPSVPPASNIPLYPNQFYGTQELYSRPDVAAAQVMAAHLQSQYTGPYGVVPASGLPVEPLGSPSATGSQNGPSANNRKLGLYKTELCRSWEEKGTCRYGTKCQFAHGEDELRKVARHPKYKTEICRTFWVSGSCPYGKRCCFIHTELPASGAAAGNGVATTTENPPPPPHTDGRARSLSTNSDPNDASVSLLARISAKRTQETTSNNTVTPIDMKASNGFQFTRPGALRVDTSALDGASIKQNKSAYPTFASNGILLPAPDRHANKSPGPVTAGPDLGRHNEARLAIVGYNNRISKPTNGMRHSLNGSEGDGSFTSPVTMHPSYTLASGEGAPRVNGHVRAGSAGTWASFTRSSLSHHHTASPAGEIMINSPWTGTELAVGSTRRNERPWA